MFKTLGRFSTSGEYDSWDLCETTVTMPPCARYKTKRDTGERSPNVPVSAHKDGNCTVYPQAGPE